MRVCHVSNALPKKTPDGTVTTEGRYFVASLSTVDWSFQHLLLLVRLHWGIESRHNWTLDIGCSELLFLALEIDREGDALVGFELEGLLPARRAHRDDEAVVALVEIELLHGRRAWR
jgi:hypothetical protein